MPKRKISPRLEAQIDRPPMPKASRDGSSAEPAARNSESRQENSEERPSFQYPLLQGLSAASRPHQPASGSQPKFAASIEKLQNLSMNDGATTGSQQIGNLINLEILKLLEERQGKSKKKSSEHGEDSESEEDEEKDFRRGIAKALHTYHEHGKYMRKKPLKVVADYVKEAKEDLGAEDHQPFQPTDVTKSVVWGEAHRNLHRFHFMESKVLHALLNNKPDDAALQCVLNLRALRQAQVNEGSWKNAWLLTHLVDPIFPRKFAGAEKDLEIIAGYQKGMEELERKTARQNPFREKPQAEPKGGARKPE